MGPGTKAPVAKRALAWLLAFLLAIGAWTGVPWLQSQAQAEDGGLQAAETLSPQASGNIVNEKGQTFSTFASAFAAVPDGGETTLTIKGLSSMTALGDLVINRNIEVTIRTTEALTATAKSGIKLSNQATLKLVGTSSKRFGVTNCSISGNSRLEMSYCTVSGAIGINGSSLDLSNVTVQDLQGTSDGLQGSVTFTNNALGSIYKSDINGSVYIGSGCLIDHILDSRIKNTASKRGNAAIKMAGGKIKRLKNSTLAGILGIEMKPGQIDYIENALIIGDSSRTDGRGILMNAASLIDSIESSNIVARTAIECTTDGGTATRSGIDAIKKTNLRASSQDMVLWKNGALGQVKFEASLENSEQVVGSGNYFCKAQYSDYQWAFLPNGYQWSNSRRSMTTPSEMKGADYRYLVANDCSLTYNGNGGSGDMSSKNLTGQLGETEVRIEQCGFTANGHAFTGWNTKADGSGKSIGAGSYYKLSDMRHVTLYAQWSGTSYTVTFDSRGGSGVAAARVPSGVALSQPANPTRDHATFAGWYTNRSCTEPYRYDFSKPVNGNLTLYAKWNMNKVTVAFNTKGGSSVGSQQVDYGGVPTKPESPTRAHYHFRRWCTDEECTRSFNFNSTDNVYGDTTLYADWNGYDYNHQWNGTVTKDPTCTETGVKTYTCNVNPSNPHTRTEEIPALGHDMKVIQLLITKPATCTEPGTATQTEKCTRCEHRATTEVSVAAKGHHTVYATEIESSTCVTHGKKWQGQRCTVCNKWISRMGTELPLAGHKWGEWKPITPASDSTTGYEEHTCSVCSRTEGRTIPKRVHEHVIKHEAAKSPTCTEPGNIEYWVCETCNKWYADEAATTEITDHKSIVVQALGHKNGEPVQENAVLPTCTATGSHEVVIRCERCNTVLSREKVTDPVIDHTPGEIVRENVVEPSCTEEGSHDEVVYCTECGAQISRTTVTDKKIDHTKAKETDFHTDATCAEPATHDEIEYCTECLEIFSWVTVEDAPALGHNPAAAVRENDHVATYCNEESHHDEVVYCSRCNEELSRTTVSDGNGKTHASPLKVTVDERAATCTEPGERDDMTYCQACGDILAWETVETAAPLGHVAGDPVRENEKPPTCTDSGHHDEATYCKREGCGAELSRVTVTDRKLGHDWGDWVEVAPATEELEGVQRRTCKRDSSHTEERHTLKTGHVAHGPLTKYPARASTCDDLGNVEFWACDTCGRMFLNEAGKVEVFSVEDIASPMPDHVAGDSRRENEKAATCTEEGGYDEVVRCRNCNQVLTSSSVVVPAHGHDASVFEIENIVEPTTTKPGSYDEVVLCAECGEELFRDTVDEPATGITYRIASGDGATWMRGSGEPLTFTFKRSEDDDETFERFSGLKVDDAQVPNSSFDAREGSVVVSLHADYLESLDAGDHRLVAQFNDDGQADASFTVKASPKPPNPDDDNSSSSSSSSSSNSNSSSSRSNTGDKAGKDNDAGNGATKSGSNGSNSSSATSTKTSSKPTSATTPKTGDELPIAYAILGIITLAAAFVMGHSLRRKRSEEDS